MKKHIYLSVVLGLIANVLLFGQVDPSAGTIDPVNVEYTSTMTIDENGDTTTLIGIIQRETHRQEITGTPSTTRLDEYEYRSTTTVTPDGDTIPVIHPATPKTRTIEKIIIIDPSKQRDVDHMVIKEQELSEEIKKEINELAFMTGAATHHRPRARMGIELDTDEGIVIKAIKEGSPAANSALRIGDRITRLGKQDVVSYKDLLRRLSDYDAGDRVRVDYVRGDKSKKTWVVLEAIPSRRHSKDCAYLKLPCLGVSYDARTEGATVIRLYEGSGAEDAGLRPGDRITKVDGEGFIVSKQFDRLVKSKEIGRMVALTVIRGEERIAIDAEIGIWDACGVCRLMEETDSEINIPATIADMEPLSYETFDVYPNPIADSYTLDFKGAPGALVVTLYDSSGQLLSQSKEQAPEGRLSRQYKVADLPRGAAFLTITQDGKMIAKQVLLQ